MFENILLEQEQVDLLIRLVEIVRSYPRNQRRKFIIAQTFGGATLLYPGHPDKNIEVLIGDLETLARESLLAQSFSSRGTPNFDITPLGFRYYDSIRQEEVQETMEDKSAAIELHSIITAGKKEVPHGTEIRARLGSVPGTIRIEIKLPGQTDYSDLGDLNIVEGTVEIPVQLVFFSYAKEDQSKVQEISNKLWQDGYLTWVDKKDLLPGDDWELRIEDAIERSDYVLVFLSPSSITKTGYVQKEFKYAVQQQELRPRGKRYIIPILLEQCNPPREFKKLHWLKYWEDKSYDILKQALSSDTNSSV